MSVDTHGSNEAGWYGFDLDGTLAVYDKWRGIEHIGAPVQPMVERIKALNAEGKKVKILTARVSPRDEVETKTNPYREGNLCIQDSDSMPWALKDRWTAKEFIQEWCYRNLDFVPEITHEKDYLMLELYDDRVKQVIPNTGILVEDLFNVLKEAIDKLSDKSEGGQQK